MPMRKKKIYHRKRKHNYDKAGVKRLLSPFSKFMYKSVRERQKLNVMADRSSNLHKGLSYKEKSYIICSCQSKSTRYRKLKNKAAEAIKEKKIFSIYGNCNAVRQALLERNWVEKIPSNRMNLSKIRNGSFSSKTKIKSELEGLLLSNFVEKYNPNFIWRTRDERRCTASQIKTDCDTIINKLEIDAVWTSKQGLCSSLKRNYWFYIEDVAEVIGPRTYNTCDSGEIEGFVKDYKITTCTSLLKWVLSMVSNERPVFVATGKISMNVIVFALNRCKEYLFRKQNKDIDQSIPSVSAGQWHSFLKKYYSIIAKEEVFQADRDNKLSLYLSYAKFLLKEIYRYRPQLSCEGCHNIWIIKPAYCSRGRGIRMASKLGVIMNLLNKANAKYVIQKYIEEPLLIHETKFDIRQYYLVTSTYPLIIWMYTDCYLKFSSQKYSLKNYHESIHLTNNAVQKNYTNCKQRSKELPTNNMWDLDKYKCYLAKIGKDDVWQNVIYPGMKKSIIGIMLSCQDSLSVSKNRFELYGCDFILDKEFNPWLIEINSCPDLRNTTQVTAKICPAVISDIIKVVIDYAKNPRASTGKFECIYRQPISLPRYRSAGELVARGYSLPFEYFYRGKIDIQKSFDSPNITKESDIKRILKKIRKYYDEDEIMKQPQEDDVLLNKIEEKPCKSISGDEETSDVTDVINGQIGELSDKITSENSSNSKCLLKKDSDQHLKQNHLISSVTNMKSLFGKSSSRLKSIQSDDNNFNFSKLDDGPAGKGSIIELGKIENLLNYSCSKFDRIHQHEIYKISNFSKDVLSATTKILSFINDKEREYYTHF
ncbi:tubulin glycylase 3A-like [Vanessa cardui]|uniref:tubulin glycylase 3A-like n=1 Tax=Vanessa cardui TaxID=171605 RepID=UPI001F12A75F|nr:tubulin glycylase 3A-like [Vanessa cardui]